MAQVIKNMVHILKGMKQVIKIIMQFIVFVLLRAFKTLGRVARKNQIFDWQRIISYSFQIWISPAARSRFGTRYEMILCCPSSENLLFSITLSLPPYGNVLSLCKDTNVIRDKQTRITKQLQRCAGFVKKLIYRLYLL